MRVSKLKIPTILMIILIALTYGIYTTTSNNSMSCQIWSRIPHGEYMLENNRWGDRHADTCIFDNGYEVGWTWDKTWPSKHPIYPEIIYGWKPWMDHSTTDKLPRKISETQKLIIELNYTSTATSYSWYNALIDIWIVRSSHPTPETITDEIGIFLETHGYFMERQKNKSLREGYEIVEVNGTTFIYVERRAFKWRFHKFYLVGDIPKKFDVMPLIRYLGLSGDLYIASVEFGNEIYMGKGLTIVRQYHVRLWTP